MNINNFIFFDTLTIYTKSLVNHKVKRMSLTDNLNESKKISQDFYDSCLKHKKYDDYSQINLIIKNKIDSINKFLIDINFATIKDDQILFDLDKIIVFNNFADSLVYLKKHYLQLIDSDAQLKSFFELWKSNPNLQLIKQDTININLINYYCFFNNLKGFSDNQIKHSCILDLFDNQFYNSLNQIESTNRKQALILNLNEYEVINNITNNDKLLKAFELNKNGYIGFDPSANSLHLGNYVMINLINRFKKHQINIIPMVGGATGCIGDPSGKKTERTLLDNETILFNKSCIINQLKKYTNSTVVLDNYNNFKEMSFLTFLRDVGKLINVNYMLEKDIVKSRLETGISFTEFSYTLMQAYDFLQFYLNNDVAFQVGGSDQWGNITTGTELIRKSVGDDNLACGFTINLLTKSDGTKFGKSEKGAIYLDKNKSSIYDMYQFLINQADNDSIKLLRFLTTIDFYYIDVINELYISSEFIKLRIPQSLLAYYLINEIHSEQDYLTALKISSCLFSNEINQLSESELKMAFDNINCTLLDDSDYNLVDFLVAANACSSKREAREMISNNSISINGNKLNQADAIINKSYTLHNLFTVIRKGKKNYFIVKWN